MTRRVLFVDDDIQVLNGLKLALRKKRDVWEMVFVDSAKAALVELERSPFDTVVSDMRMPLCDGAQLLKQVKEQWPSSIRVILSGDLGIEGLERATKVAHHCLSKPCDFAVLSLAIENASPSINA